MQTPGAHRPTTRALIIAAAVVVTICFEARARQDACTPAPEPTFTVSLPRLGLPPDEEGQGWARPAVWAGYPAGDDSIVVPNGRPIYALLVSGYAQNANLDQVTFYNFARHLMARGAYVHYAWWNNLLAPYTERPLHYGQSHPGTTADLTSFVSAAQAADKAVPGEDYQFVADATRLLHAIREHNPSAIIVVAGHSMGGGSVVHLASQADVVIDIVAPIDPVGNRNYPWAGPVLYSGQSYFNWTRWRATRDDFLGFRLRRLIDGCDPSGPWLADIGDAFTACPAGPYAHAAPALRFGPHVVNLYHRWQNEALFPFDYPDTYTFGHSRPPGGTTSQAAVTTRAVGSDPGGWPLINFGGTCCPDGAGVAWPADGHGEIVGFRGPGATQPLAARVRTSPLCSGCGGLTWPARTLSSGVWSNGNSSSRRSLLVNLESLPLSQTWAHQPYNPNLCLVSQGLINLYNAMNKPPVANAGPNQTVTCAGCPAAAVTLDGSGSSDPNNDTLRYTWAWDFGSAAGQVAHVQIPPGTHCVTLEVADPSGHVARDVVSVTVVNPADPVVPFTSLATGWMATAGRFEARAFDEFFPGVAGATRCLLPSPSQPAVVALAGGTLTVSARQSGAPTCAITDASASPAVSDAIIGGPQSVVRFEFAPPVSAFYTFYGSLASGQTATMSLYDAGGALVRTLTTPPSTDSALAAGQGFTSTIPIARVEFSSTEPGGVLVGAFVGLRPGEQSLGTVDLGGYPGPGGSGAVHLDFACTFGPACGADFDGNGTVNLSDFLAFLGSYAAGDGRADFNGDGRVNLSDFLGFLSAFAAGC
jgi:hypothetical protein